MSGFTISSSGLTGPFVRQATSANNLANLPTPGFRAARSNPLPSGSTTQSDRQGFLRRTGRPTDLAVQGEGFFVLRDGDQTLFTRSGSFGRDAEGRVVHSATGGILQVGDENGGLRDLQIGKDSSTREGPAGELRGFSFDRDGTVLARFGDGRVEERARVNLATFQNPGGLKPRGETLFSRTPNSGTPGLGPPGTGGRGILAAGVLESSNVDLAGELVGQLINVLSLRANVSTVRARDEAVGDLLDVLG